MRDQTLGSGIEAGAINGAFMAEAFALPIARLNVSGLIVLKQERFLRCAMENMRPEGSA